MVETIIIPSLLLALKMSDLFALTEFYKTNGFSGKEAVERAEVQLEKQLGEKEKERLLEVKRMEHEEKMRGVSCCRLAIFFHFVIASF